MAKPKYASVLTKAFLKQRYLEEKRSTNFISAETGIEAVNVQNYLRRYGIPLRTSAESRSVAVDWQGFDELSTDWYAYWTGFIAADGCVFVHGGSARVQVILKATDADHLRDLQLGLKTKVPVTLYNGQRNVAKLIIYSQELVTALAKWGIVSKKTLTMPWPTQLPASVIPAFIRGYFDGDGTIFHRHRSISGTTWTETICRFISGSIPFLEGLQQELSTRGVQTLKIYRNQKGNAFFLPVSTRRENLLAFANLIYTGQTVCLERKRTLFLEMEAYHAAHPRKGPWLRYQAG